MVWNAMNSNSGNMVYKITILLLGFILMSAAPFASAQFSVGAGPASSGGSGGSSSDDIAPSFTTAFSKDDYPLRISGVNYPLVMTGNIPTQTIKTGETIQIELMMYENSGPQNVRHVDMYLNQKGNRIQNDNSETAITFDSDQMQLRDPLNLIESANVVSSVLGNKIHFLFDVSFSKTIDTSDILFRTWDTNRNAAYLHIPDALQVIDSEDMSSGDAVINDDVVDTSQDSILPTINESSFSDAFDQWAGYATTSMPDADFLNQLGMDAEHVPKWFKQNNAKWFKDGLISQDDFVTALDDLNNRGIL